MQVNNLKDATVVEFKWSCGCKHIIEKSEIGKFREKEHCGQQHGKLLLHKAQRTLFN